MFGKAASVAEYFEKSPAVIRSFLLSCILLLSLGVVPAHAQQDIAASDESRTMAAAGRKTRVAVIGDSLAFELWKGLYPISRSNRSLEFVKFTRVSTGLVRRDVYDWNKRIREIVRNKRFDVAVVVLGGNDRQSVWVGKRRLTRGSKAWFREYAARADRFMKTLRRAGKPVYWVGLPIVRSAQMARDYRRFNKLFRQLAARNGFHYVDTWRAFADARGHYTSFGRDSKGAKRRMRNNDGLHFTDYGRLKFGRFVYKHLRSAIGRHGPS